MANYTLWNEWPSNFSNATSVDGVGSWFQYTNDITSGIFGGLILFLIFGVSFIVQGGNSEKRGAVSLFITSFIATLLMRIELISFHVVIPLWIFTIVMIILVRNSTNAGRL